MPYKNPEDKLRNTRRYARECREKKLAYQGAVSRSPKGKGVSAKYYRVNSPEIKAKRATERRTPKGRFSIARGAAKHRGLDWVLSFDEHMELLAHPCYYCQGPLNETSIGLDRLDHRLGYVHGNVVPCCGKCNTRKGHLEAVGFFYPRTVELMRELFAGESADQEG